MRFLSPARAVAVLLVLAGIALAVLWFVPSGSYIFLPDRAHPVAPRVSVKGAHPPRPGTGIYYVDVFVRKATLLEELFPSIRDGATILPASSFNPAGASESQLERQNLNEMRQSQHIAAALALQALGYGHFVSLHGIRVDAVVKGVPAAAKLRPGDVIVSARGRRVGSACTLRNVLGATGVGRAVQLTLRRGKRLRSVSVRTIREPGTGHPILGIEVTDDVSVRKLPLAVQFDLGSVGGPSAGLAFALDLMQELGPDITHGHRVAATGQLEPDGCVSAIGGVEQKTLGARSAKVDALLVPAGENAQEARRYAHGLHIISVDSFRQALRAVATLPP
jgi:Lon-like protease